MPQTSPTLNVMIAAARKAAKALTRDFGEVENLQVSRKGPSDFVTSADLKAEKTLFEELSKARPGYSFLMEERGAVEGTDKSHRWIVDPLDGTTNFMHGIPHFADLDWARARRRARRRRHLQSGTRRIVLGRKGRRRLSQRQAVACRGAQRSARRADRHRRAISSASLATTQFLAEADRVIAADLGIRRMGSASLDLAYVAAGRYDGFWERNLGGMGCRSRRCAGA